MTECNPLVKTGKTKGKRAGRLRQTKKRHDAKRLARKREIVSGEERNVERIVLAPDPLSPIATEIVRQDARESTDVGKGNMKHKRAMSLKSTQIVLVRTDNVLTASNYVHYCTKNSVNLVCFTQSAISAKVEEKQG